MSKIKLSCRAFALLLVTCVDGALLAQTAEPPIDPNDDIVVNGRSYPSPRIYIDFMPPVSINNGAAVFVDENSVSFTNRHACIKKNTKCEAGADQLWKDFQTALQVQPDANAREYGSF